MTRWSRNGRLIWVWFCVVLAAAVWLRWSTLDTGLHMDDIAQRAMVRGDFPSPRSWWDLYRFAPGGSGNLALMNHGALPWWSDPQLRLSALRPLASGLIYFDVWALSTWGAHLHSLIWWVALLVALHWTLRQVLTPGWAVLAVALYAFDDCHIYPLAWLANRTALISMFFAVLALGMHLRWREAGERYGKWAGPLCGVIALSGGEYGICGLAYVAAYELVGSRQAIGLRLRALLPYIVAVLVYLLLHRGLGFGAKASAVYVDPFAEPLNYVDAVVERVPLLLGDMLSGIDVARVGALVATYPLASLVVVFALIAWGASERASWSVQQRATLRWALLGSALALLPVASSFLSARLTVAAALGTHVLLAGLVVRSYARGKQLRSARTWLGLVLSLTVLSAHMAGAAYWGQLATTELRVFNQRARQVALAMRVEDDDVRQQRWVLFAAADPVVMLYPPQLRRLAGHPLPRAWWVLSLAPSVHRIRRVSPRALEITVDQGAMLQRPLEQFFRHPEHGFQALQTVALDGLDITVLDVDDFGAPRRIRYTFDRPLEDPTLRFFVMGTHGLVRYPLAGVGATMTLPRPAAVTDVDPNALQR